MKKHTYWAITIIAIFFGGVGALISIYFFQLSPPPATITFTPPNIWELCQQAYSAPHPIPPEFFPKEFREYWVQNHMFYVGIGGIHDSHNCAFIRSYEGNFEITVKKKEGK